jgi:2-oxoglutarate dehydrogenase E2 component (dihydrolipoamide succinyltransferase)
MKETYLADLQHKQKDDLASVPFSTIQHVENVEKKETKRPLSKIRQVIASRMVEAQQTMAMLTTFNEVDLSEIIKLREKHKEIFIKKYGTKLGFMSFFVKAAVSALKAFPMVNSYLEANHIVERHYYDIGIAVGTDRGTLVPVVRECEKLSFAQIELSIDEFANKAREGKITMDDLQGGGFTITNGGVYGSLLSTPILNPPQCAILVMHKIEKRPVVVDDQIVIRPMMYLALSYDHRLIDGKESVAFLVHIKNALEDPSRLLFEL